MGLPEGSHAGLQILNATAAINMEIPLGSPENQGGKGGWGEVSQLKRRVGKSCTQTPGGG